MILYTLSENQRPHWPASYNNLLYILDHSLFILISSPTYKPLHSNVISILCFLNVEISIMLGCKPQVFILCQIL